MRPTGDMTTTTDEVRTSTRRRPGVPRSCGRDPPRRHSVRGVNVMRVVDGKIVEAAGYSKTAPTVAALEG